MLEYWPEMLYSGIRDAGSVLAGCPPAGWICHSTRKRRPDRVDPTLDCRQTPTSKEERDLGVSSTQMVRWMSGMASWSWPWP
ncbi:unnamed protein product [Clonostachys solani]|uniref:Uncharacterized protein n=1 Tax=Clonostachys solani TaxID=160281 RepID=A0A9N9Z9Z9_9HYPO|nr:unnamed protein product [Clonostachys solani]